MSLFFIYLMKINFIYEFIYLMRTRTYVFTKRFANCAEIGRYPLQILEEKTKLYFLPFLW